MTALLASTGILDLHQIILSKKAIQKVKTDIVGKRIYDENGQLVARVVASVLTEQGVEIRIQWQVEGKKSETDNCSVKFNNDYSIKLLDFKEEVKETVVEMATELGGELYKKNAQAIVKFIQSNWIEIMSAVVSIQMGIPGGSEKVNLLFQDALKRIVGISNDPEIQKLLLKLFEKLNLSKDFIPGEKQLSIEGILEIMEGFRNGISRS